MTAWAYYNELDPFAAAWLRELIKDGLISPGEVDERSIEDVTPDELRPFRQCHFFAGIGVWSLAARRAGFDDDAPLWSGSCPCQPFSAAGKGGGFADERHLWPAFHYLIEQCRPSLVVGEQVAGTDGDAWVDLVSADLDATGYAFGVAEICAAGFGAPHIRSRNYWVAHADQQRQSRSGIMGRSGNSEASGDREVDRIVDDGRDSGLAHGHGHGHGQRTARDAGRGKPERDAQSGDAVDGLADADAIERNQWGPAARHEAGPSAGNARNGASGDMQRSGSTNGIWQDADWLRCRDKKWRPVEPDTFPLADAGAFRNRVGLLRGAGNAVTLGQAQGFLEAVRASVAL